MRWFLFLLAATVGAQSFETSLDKPEQGQVMKVTSDKAVSARLNGRTIKLFPQPDGPALGLMPIPTLEKPGKYQLEFLDQNGSVVHTTPITVQDAYYPRRTLASPLPPRP